MNKWSNTVKLLKTFAAKGVLGEFSYRFCPHLKRTEVKSIIYVSALNETKRSVQILNHRYIRHWNSLYIYSGYVIKLRNTERKNAKRIHRNRKDQIRSWPEIIFQHLSVIISVRNPFPQWFFAERTFGSTKNWSHTQYSYAQKYYDPQKVTKKKNQQNSVQKEKWKRRINNIKKERKKGKQHWNWQRIKKKNNRIKDPNG